MRTEIYLYSDFDNNIGLGKLELFDDEPINLVYNVSDIKNINSKDSNHTLDFTIPGCLENNKLLGHIYNLGTDSDFDTRIKVPCVVMVDGISIMSGNFQLLRVKISDKQPELYECIVYGEIIDLSKSIGESLLEHLDFSELDHNLTSDVVLESWTASTPNYGFFYSLIDNGQNWFASGDGDTSWNNVAWGGISFQNVNNPYTQASQFGIPPSEFTFCFSAKYIIDKILSNAEFSYSSEFFESSKFGDIVIPTNSSKQSYSEEFVNDFTFKAYTDSSATLTYPFDDEIIINFNDDSIDGFDNSDLYNTTTNRYTANETLCQQFFVNLNISYPVQLPVGNYFLVVNFYRSTYNGGSVPYTSIYRKMDFNFQSGTLYFESDSLDNEYSDKLYPAQPGETFWVRVFTNKWRLPLEPFSSYKEPWDNKPTIGVDSNFGNKVGTKAVLNGPMKVNSLIPKNIKQIDFLKSIFTMFNIMVVPSKDNIKKINFIPRDDFYSTGRVKNWTKFVDVDTVTEEFLSEKIDRKIKLTYKEDKDYYNTFYKEGTQTIYGEYNREFENEWVDGEKKIDIIFSPTPIESINGAPDIIIPKIVKKETSGQYTKTESNIRIGFKKLKSINSFITLYGKPSLYYYPYFGHFDDPTNPENDLNFGQLNYTFYDIDDITENTLEYKYWRKYLDQINDKDSRIVKCEAYLSSAELSQFNFNDIIYIETISDDGGHYFIVNKIEYIANSDSMSKLELVKLKVLPFKAETKKKINKTKIALNIGTFGERNLNFNTTTVTLGSDNIVMSKESMIIGDRNYITTALSEVIVRGSDNTVSGDTSGVTIFGSGNKVGTTTGEPIRNVTLLGVDNYTVTDSSQSGTFFIGRTVQALHILEAGRDEVLSSFTDTIINYRMAGRDEIRGIGSYDTTQHIIAGRDSII